ncbi:C40 family peptidase [Bombilactobacillus thymidiniphilus]|uniref:NlpC/P60 family protein n=1 Tax=Bombilactobacillus thymidiniphilus TaxID=2923363 RepID=A0ABY4PF43_9LACO|nr:C40 family peptidase [Bombilactobacillus thymidiniphilus]UQS84141.1 NlpC/P60 family protein [Bombilactobacillus thymidiniphilus]
MISKKHLISLVAASFIGISAATVSQQNTETTAHAANVGQGITVDVYGSSIGLRTAPNDGASLTGQYVPDGSSWAVAGVSDDGQWYNLGNNDWIKASYVKDMVDNSRSAQAQKLIDAAKAQYGKPYSWGAKGPNAFDCSGLMNYVFKQALGKDIGGYTVAQESAGQKISLNDLQPGDLVFWGGQGSSYHVALYAGNNQYIDAPAPGQTVGMRSISGYFYPSFGVRVLN